MSFSSDYRRSSYKKEIVWRKIINFSNIDYRLSIDFQSTFDRLSTIDFQKAYRLSETLSTFGLLMGGQSEKGAKKPGDFKNPSVFLFLAADNYIM